MTAPWGNYSSETAEEAELAEDEFNAETAENAESIHRLCGASRAASIKSQVLLHRAEHYREVSAHSNAIGVGSARFQAGMLGA